MKVNLVTQLVYKRKNSKTNIVRSFLTKCISFCGADIPAGVIVGENVSFCHNCLGSVIYDGTVIGDNVRVYQNVTVGQADPFTKNPASMVISDGAVLCAGAKILGKGNLVVGKNTIVASNAVLLCSTGENEVWAGIPARRIKKRDT